MTLYYEEPLYRPPSEAGSLLIQATVGCAFAHCTYCISSVTGRFAIRPLAEIKQDLVEARRLYGPEVPKIFLLAQDALVMPAADLVALSDDGPWALSRIAANLAVRPPPGPAQ